MQPRIEVNCDHCGSSVALVATQVRRARKRGMSLYCNMVCMGLARRKPTARRWQPRVRRTPSICAMTLAERLEWSSIPEPNCGCTLWFGTVTNKGYGHFKWQKKDFLAHRAAYEVAHGTVPDDLFVCHRCDMPPCINPDHLFLGTHDDNMADMVGKNRHAHGMRHHGAKVTLPLAVTIFNAPGEQRDIGAQFDVSQTTVWKIKTEIHWLCKTPEWRQAFVKMDEEETPPT